MTRMLKKLIENDVKLRVIANETQEKVDNLSKVVNILSKDMKKLLNDITKLNQQPRPTTYTLVLAKISDEIRNEITELKNLDRMYPDKPVYKHQDGSTIYAFIPENDIDALKFTHSITRELKYCNGVIFVSITNEIHERFIVHPEYLIVPATNTRISTCINRVDINPEWYNIYLEPPIEVPRANFIIENDLTFTSLAGRLISTVEYNFNKNYGPVERLAVYGSSLGNERPSGSQTAMGFALAAIQSWPHNDASDNVRP